MGTATAQRVKGDTFILCAFHLMDGGRPYVLDSGNSPEDVCKSIIEHIGDEDTLSLCRVGYWVANPRDPWDPIPCDVETIFQTTTYNLNALYEEEDGDQ